MTFADATCRLSVGMMNKRRAPRSASIALAALLITSALGQQSEDNQGLKPVDLTKDGFDITLQALPSGEKSYESLTHALQRNVFRKDICIGPAMQSPPASVCFAKPHAPCIMPIPADVRILQHVQVGGCSWSSMRAGAPHASISSHTMTRRVACHPASQCHAKHS